MAIERLNLNNEEEQIKRDIKNKIETTIFKNKKLAQLSQDDYNNLVLQIAKLLDLEIPE